MYPGSLHLLPVAIKQFLQSRNHGRLPPSMLEGSNHFRDQKGNKPNYMIPKAYRTGSLLNWLEKISEKIVATCLAVMAERHHLLHRWQIGGEPKMSAVDTCLMIARIAHEARQKKLVTSTLCMDVKGAFAIVYLKWLLNTLIEKDLPPPLQKWVVPFLSDRTARLTFDGQMEEISPVQTSIPQGSPVSRILFLL